MSLLDDLRQVRKSAAVAFFEFIRDNPKLADSVHAFFEGQSDLSFYRNFLERFVSAPTTLRTYECGGKHGVYTTHNKIVQRSDLQAIVVCFVDRDFADLLGANYPVADNMYVTDHYSIENYLVSADMLGRIWDEMIHVEPEEIDLKPIQVKFETELARFHGFMLPVTAWIIYVQRNGQKIDENHINLAAFFSLADDLTLQCSHETDYMGMVGVLDGHCKVVTPAELLPGIDVVKAELSALPPKRYVRGKFELWFFVQFVNKLTSLLRQTLSGAGQPLSVNVRLQFGQANALIVLGPRLPIPPSLETFLQRNIGEKLRARAS